MPSARPLLTILMSLTRPAAAIQPGCEHFRDVMEKSPAPHLLVIDDESLIRWSIAETLIHSGWVVTEAANASGALERLAVPPAPDVILLDYRLPDSNDLTLLETIRRRGPDIPIIMMTAYETPAMQAGALALGAHLVVSKPIEMGTLVPLVRHAYDARAR